MSLGHPLNAQRLGIGIIHQELDLFPHLTVGENLIIGNLQFSEGAFVGTHAIEEFPVDPSVPEHLQEIAATVAGMGEFAGEAHALHRAAHAAELERIENPRPNESLWDVVENQ